jgi:uncharacterized protein with FMN-binding domain
MKSKIIGAVVIVLAGLGIGYWYENKKGMEANTMPTDNLTPDRGTGNSAPSESINPGAETTPVSYKDGSYNLLQSYFSPAGKENIDVTVTLKNGVVSAVVVKNGSNDSTSSNYQNRFISKVQSVVGQNIADLNVGVLSGSSLTSGAFNNALNTIRQRAKM